MVRGKHGIPKTYVAMRTTDGVGQDAALNLDDIPGIFTGKVVIQPDKCCKCGQDLGDGDNLSVDMVGGEVQASHKVCPPKET